MIKTNKISPTKQERFFLVKKIVDISQALMSFFCNADWLPTRYKSWTQIRLCDESDIDSLISKGERNIEKSFTERNKRVE